MNANDHPTRNALLLLLSAAAGCVDALAFIKAGVFPANMTGNSVVLATNLLHPASSGVFLSLMALAGFCAGAAASAWTVHSPDHAWSHRINRALLAAGVLITGATITLFLTGNHFLPFIILATATAMGMQSAAVQKLAIPGVATVFITGTLTTAVSRLAGTVRERAEGLPLTEKGPWLPALTWLAYFAGAFIGSLHHFFGTPIPFAIPCLLLLAVPLLSGQGFWPAGKCKK